MAVNAYEGLFIFDSNRYGRDPAGISGQLETVITEAGGEVLASRLWEERRLAYPIKRQRKGTYWLTYFKLDSLEIQNINRKFELSDSILRSLVLKVDPRILDTLVAHASAKPEPAKPTPEVVDGETDSSDAEDDAATETDVESEETAVKS